MEKTLIGIVIGACLASLAWWVVTVATDGAPDTEVTVTDELDVGRLLRPMREEIARALAARPAESAEVDDPVREEVAPSLDLAARLEGLEATLANMEARLETVLVVSTSPPPTYPKNEGAIARAITLEQSNPKASRHQHFSWTPAMLYRTYGLPDSTYTSGSQYVTWEYFGQPGQRVVQFTFTHGILEKVGLREPRR